MTLQATFLNCTLKKSPQVSHTRALIDKVIGLMQPLGVECHVIRVVDHTIPFGIESDMGEGDDWPRIYDRLKASDIIVIGMPIWFGVRSSVAQLVIERLERLLQRRPSSHRSVPALQQGCSYHRDRQRRRRSRLRGEHTVQSVAPGLRRSAQLRLLLGRSGRSRP